MSVTAVYPATDNSPELIVNQQLALFESSSNPVHFFAVSYDYQQYWLEDAQVSLLGFYQFTRCAEALQIEFAVAEQSPELKESVIAARTLAEFCEKHELAVFNPSSPALLKPISIPKPWGQEIWYTGIEQRGVVDVVGLNGRLLSLPFMISALPQYLAGQYAQSLILLKILDPSPEPVIGDLYFELHEQKREVYVVTAIDEGAWPNGEGAIRFGFNDEVLAKYPSEAAFKSAFADSVKAYEKTRREIDALSDLGQTVDNSLRTLELDQRNNMNAFTHMQPLSLGDVVKVPCLTPHSLQHGVRTVEFQTPVYERLIVSFAQKVLTQNHWDTDRALQLMDVQPNAGGDDIEVLAEEPYQTGSPT